MVNSIVVLVLLALAVSPTTALSKGRTYNDNKEKDKQETTIEDFRTLTFQISFWYHQGGFGWNCA